MGGLWRICNNTDAWKSLTPAQKKHALFLKQKALLDLFFGKERDHEGAV